jgi:hypothetical protein
MGDGSRTITDAAGKFELPIAGNGALLRVRKGRFALPQPVTVGAERDLKLTLSDKTDGLAVVHVVGENNQPLAGVTVGVRISSGVAEMAPRWGITSSEGTFALSPVYGDRNYRVFVGGSQYTAATGSFTAMAGTRVDVTPLQVFRADSFITGMVINELGEPLPNVQVMVTGGRSAGQSVRTNDQGRFRVDKLVAGDTVTVRTASASLGTATTQLRAGTADAVITYIPRPIATPARGGARGRGTATPPPVQP